MRVRFFSGPLVRATVEPLRMAGFAFGIELIARCQRLSASPTEIPVHWRDVAGSAFSVQCHSAAAATGQPPAVTAQAGLPGRSGPCR